MPAVGDTLTPAQRKKCDQPPSEISLVRKAHAALDRAVMAAYGFDPSGDLLAQLLALNLAVAARIDAGQAVVGPGVPPAYPDPAALVSDDCIRAT